MPKVRAAIAGPKTSPTMAIRLLARVTGQKVGHAKMMTAPTASTANAATITPRLPRVASIAAPIGVCTPIAEQAADRGHQSDLGLAPVLLGDQEHVEIWPQRAAHVGKQEVEGVERERIEAPARVGFHSHSQSVPSARVMPGAIRTSGHKRLEQPLR